MPDNPLNPLEIAYGIRQGPISIKPLWAVGNILSESKKVEEDLIQWVMDAYRILENESWSRNRTMFENIGLYMSLTTGHRSARISRGTIIDRTATRTSRPLRVNHLYEMTESHIASIASSRPAVSILPSASDEYADKVAAKTAKTVVESIWYEQDVDNTFRRNQRTALICGESYLLIHWDPNAGPKHPSAKEAAKMGIKEVELRDEKNVVVKTEDGKSIKIPTDQRIGEVSYERWLSWDVFKEPAEFGRQEDWIMHRRYVNVETLKAEYPDKQDKIKATESGSVFSLNNLSHENVGDRVLVLSLYHRSTPQLPNGMIIRITPEVILEKNEIDLPSLNSRRLLPIVSLKDGEIDGLQYGWPITVFETGKGIQTAINNITSVILRNAAIMAPKWAMPDGTTSEKNLGNGPTIFKYNPDLGPPTLIAPPPVSQELFLFRDKLKDDLQQITGVHGISRGEPPGSIRAGVALQFLEEQEIKRRTSMIAKYNDFIAKVAIVTLAIAGDKYEESDGRVAKLFGRFNTVRLKKFKAADLSKYYDVHVQRSSALPESQSAKVQLLLDISREKPDMISNEQFLDLIELPRSDRLFNITTAALDAAESDWEDFVEGEDVVAPEEWYDLVTYWQVFSKNIQSKVFRTEVPQDIHDLILDHLMALESLMLGKAQKNGIFAQQITALSQFPRIFQPGPEDIALLGGLGGQPPFAEEGGPGGQGGNLGQLPGPQNEIVSEDLL